MKVKQQHDSTCCLQQWAVFPGVWWTWRWWSGGPEGFWVGGEKKGWLQGSCERRTPTCHCCLGLPALFSSDWQKDWWYWCWTALQAPRHYHSSLMEEPKVEGCFNTIQDKDDFKCLLVFAYFKGFWSTFKDNKGVKTIWWLTNGEFKADGLVSNFPVNHGGFKQGAEQQKILLFVCIQLDT